MISSDVFSSHTEVQQLFTSSYLGNTPCDLLPDDPDLFKGQPSTFSPLKVSSCINQFVSDKIFLFH